MSLDRHLARLERLQRMHGLLVRRQATKLTAAEAAERQAGERLRRVQSLLAATGMKPGQQPVALLAAGATLRGLLARALEAERQQLGAAREARLEQAERQQAMDARAERLADRVVGARRRVAAEAADRQASSPVAPGKDRP